MTGLLAVVRREVARQRRRPVALLLGLVLPPVAFALLLAIFARPVPTDLPVVVVDRDGSSFARRLARMLDAAPSMAVVARTGDPAVAHDALLRGTAYAAIVIPEDVERRALRGEAPAIVLETNSQWLIPASILRRDATEVVGTLSAGIEIAQREARGEGALARARFEPVRVERHALFNPHPNYALYLLGGLLPTMLQLFVLVAAVDAVGSELRDGTAGAWLDAAGGRTAVALAGKLLPLVAVFFGQAALMLGLLRAVVGLPLPGSAAMLAAGTAALVLAYAGLGALVVGTSRGLRFATSSAAVIASPAFAFAGLTFPAEGMTAFAQGWGAALPLTHYLGLFVEQGMRGAPAAASWPELGILLAFAAGSALLALPLLARLLRDPSCWGRP